MQVIIGWSFHPPPHTQSYVRAQFKSIQFAYEVLSNPEKRQMYDQFGISAVKDGGGDSGASTSNE